MACPSGPGSLPDGVRGLWPRTSSSLDAVTESWPVLASQSLGGTPWSLEPNPNSARSGNLGAPSVYMLWLWGNRPSMVTRTLSVVLVPSLPDSARQPSGWEPFLES